ncbi:hypothetical protein WICMUC_000406 [Wickerhamomyces mucosus]|uniref:rRNA methyltransferase 2, mitochondrial n=1 Tax=Wickerhamomyces mucosus TaxID=1378264 RepID=A0A9P8Q008_9ASCO|nr:hypothetical protein WICMUC_000406 [Wickerhamomyces mucosus]
MITGVRSPSAFPELLTVFYRFYSKKSSSSTQWLNRASKDPYTKAARFQDYKSRAAFKLKELNKNHNLFKPGYTVVDLGFAPGAWSQVAVELTKPHGRVLGVDIIPANPPKGASSIQANILSKKTHTIIRNFFIETDYNKQNDDDDLGKPKSYIATELQEPVELELEENDQKSNNNTHKNLPVELSEKQQFPVDIVISDMYAPVLPPERYWNNTTNSAFHRMANTSGLVIRDNVASINLCDAALILAIDLLKPNGAFVCKFFTGEEDKGLEKRLRKVFKKVIRDKPNACRDESKECYFVCFQKKKTVDKIDVFTNFHEVKL